MRGGRDDVQVRDQQRRILGGGLRQVQLVATPGVAPFGRPPGLGIMGDDDHLPTLPIVKRRGRPCLHIRSHSHARFGPHARFGLNICVNSLVRLSFPCFSSLCFSPCSRRELALMRV